MYWATELDEVEGQEKRVDGIVTALVSNKVDLPEDKIAIQPEIGT
jgi:hypothetical protein